ncbi:MAG TPA: hypothetical protein VGJ90_08980 [Methylophilaceae bacterium]|jgi:hypothetical protein
MLALSKLFLLLGFFAVNVALADDADTALGNASGLSGTVENNAVTLPKQPAVNVPNGVRPIIILPPEEYQPHTLVVPLANEKSPPVILRRDSTETLQNNQPALPKNVIHQQNGAGKEVGERIKTKPLAPVVY